MANLSNLSPSEYEQIAGVLKRDRELRSMEETRIRQLKQELLFLRQRAVLKPGFDPQRCCARCLVELGRILNRGSLCPLCLKKVCKDCRNYGDENHEWLCIYCYKQMQLKAVSGEWMLEFSRLSVHNQNSSTDQWVQRAHSQGATENDDKGSNSSLISVESPPGKPPRIFSYEPPFQKLSSRPSETLNQSTNCNEDEPTKSSAKDTPLQRQESSSHRLSPKMLSRISPWTDIDPEPTIPVRINKSRPFSALQQNEVVESINFKERQSSDEGRCTLGYRSRSSSDVMEESESHVPVPSPRKRLNPLKKQQAIPDQICVDNQQSSVETTDSGVCSPGTLDISSPLVSTVPSNDHESFTQCLVSESSLSETDEERFSHAKISGDYGKKRKSIAEEKHSVHSADFQSSIPPMGLNHSFFQHNICSNPLCVTNFKQNIIRFHPIFSYKFRSGYDACACLKQNNCTFTRNNSKFSAKMSACNSEALFSGIKARARSKGTKQPKILDGRWNDPNSSINVESNAGEQHDRKKNRLLRFSLFREKQNKQKRKFQDVQMATADFSSCNISMKSHLKRELNPPYKDVLFYLGINDKSSQISSSLNSCVENSRTPLVRSSSLPSITAFSEDCSDTWLRKSRSVEDLWYLVEQPCQRRNSHEIFNMLPDDYKLVYVSSSSSSSSSDECLNKCDSPVDRTYPFRFSSRDHLKVKSRIKVSNGTFYSEDSDWEMESDGSEELGSFDISETECAHQMNEAKERSTNCASTVGQNSAVVNYKFQREITKLELITSIDHFNRSSDQNMQVDSSNSTVQDTDFLLKPSFLPFSMLNKNFPLCLHIISSKSFVNVVKVENYKKLPTSVKNIPCSMILLPNYRIFYDPCLLFSIIDNFTDSITNNSRLFGTSLQNQLIFYTDEISRHSAVADYLTRYIQDILKYYQGVYIDQCTCIYFLCSLCHFVSYLFRNSNALDVIARNLLETNLLSFKGKCILSQKYVGKFKCDHIASISVTKTPSQTAVLITEKGKLPPVIDTNPHLSHVTNTTFPHNDSITFILTEKNCIRNNLNFISKYKSASKCAYPVSLHSLYNIRSEFYNALERILRSNETPRKDVFYSPCWRDCLKGKVGNWLQLDDANAFHYSALPLFSYATNRSNDNSAIDWGKLRCCIAAALRQRVIDLNPRALVCGREVLDSDDLTSYLGWKAGSEVELSSSGDLVNAFSYRIPPVFSKPEADYLLLSTRLERCVFQRSFHAKAKVETRMIAPNFEVTGASAFDKTHHDNKSSLTETEQNCEGIRSHDSDNFSENYNCNISIIENDCSWIIGKQELLMSCENRKSYCSRCKNVNEFRFHSLPLESLDCRDESVSTQGATYFNEIKKLCLNCDINQSKHVRESDSSGFFDNEILPCIKYLFDGDFEKEYFNFDKELISTIVSDHTDGNERVDCQCNQPCQVPSSPSVVDATVERINTDDGEIFSSGDELDKFESDTDSQDTVIEGEAYKRIRSVAIKEKILHANEELFGSNSKETFFNSYSSNILPSSTHACINQQVKICSLDEIKCSESSNSSLQTKYRNDIPELPLFSDSEESDALTIFSSLQKHFQSFKKETLPPYCSVSSTFSKNDLNQSEDSQNRTEMISLSSYCSPFSESLCSSESSDNGSDGEEMILSDTSTSSDEATYVASTAGFQYYSHSVSYKLHTIAEESCEESERSSRNSVRSHSNPEYLEKIRLSSKNSRKASPKLLPDNHILSSNSDHKPGKGSAVYAVMATSRLEKYFKSGLQEGNEMSYPDDEMTDESGEVSSDDDTTSNRLRNYVSSGKKSEKLHKIPKGNSSMEKSSSGKCKFENSCPLKNRYTNAKMFHRVEPKGDLESDKSNILLKSENSAFELTQNSEQVSDEEAKFIMKNLMQHITNTDSKEESKSEIKDMTPMIKILESEIARLMLTVSPASLSAGEPSSSCSSTIGSNNSDYGSDTLESAEDSTSENELNAEISPENQPVVDISPHIDSVSLQNEAPSSSNSESVNFTSTSDPVVSEETLYICKQLMASLKKIADSPEVACASDEICTASEDHCAKQYITDQIVSLMQTVNASHNNSPLLRRSNSNLLPSMQVDSDVSQDRSDSDSPPPNDEKREHSKSKTPSESGSETTISASISIPSYDDSDRTPTESEISHEMDELYALLESSSATQDVISSKFSCDIDSPSSDKNESSRNSDSPLSEDINFSFSDSCDVISNSETECSLLYGAASKLESLLPISIEERIARYKDAYLNKVFDFKEQELKSSETRINVILPQPSTSDSICDDIPMSNSLPSNFDSIFHKSEQRFSVIKSCDDILSSCMHKTKSDDNNYNVTSVKIISHNTYPPSSAVHKILSNNADSTYLDHTQKHDHKVVSICDPTSEKGPVSEEIVEKFTSSDDSNQFAENTESDSLSPMPKVINPKEKASSENDLLIANYRTKSKSNKVFGTKSVGNICELENISTKCAFRDTGYYSFKSSEDSFLSLDDSTASQTSTASLTQYRSLTSTETIPEEEESCVKGTTSAKMSLSSSNIPDAVCGTSASKSSTLPLSLRNKLSSTSNTSHRTRSSFFSTSGVLRKLTLLRDESGNSLRSSPHNRLRMRNRSLSGGSEDGRQRKTSLPQISVSGCLEGQTARLSTASSDKDSSGMQDDEIDQPLAYPCRSQLSLSSFGGRSESVTSVYSAAGGGRYGTVIVTGDVLFGFSYSYKIGTMEINIKECRNLAPVDTKRNRSDPYVKVYLLPDRTKSGKRKTKVKKHTLNPVFDEVLKFHVTISELEIRTLWLSVWHSDRFGRNDFLGEVMLPLGTDAFESSGLKWYPLQERLETLDAPVSYKGDLILALKYVPPDVTSRKFSKKPGSPVKGSLEILVREARNLMATRSNGTSDPFCKSYLLPDKSKGGKQKTSVLKKSCNPKWNHTFVYDDVSLDDLRERCLELTIWDYDKITSNDFLGGVRLCLGTGKYQGRDVDWMDSVGEERSLWYTMLERPNKWVDGSLLLRPSMQSRRAM